MNVSSKLRTEGIDTSSICCRSAFLFGLLSCVFCLASSVFRRFLTLAASRTSRRVRASRGRNR